MLFRTDAKARAFAEHIAHASQEREEDPAWVCFGFRGNGFDDCSDDAVISIGMKRMPFDGIGLMLKRDK